MPSAECQSRLLPILGVVAFAQMWGEYATPPWNLVKATVGSNVLDITRFSAALHVLAASLFVWPGVFTAAFRWRSAWKVAASAARVARLTTSRSTLML